MNFFKRKKDQSSLDFPPLEFSFLGDMAILCQVGSELTLKIQEKIWFVDEQIAQEVGVSETTPGMNNLLVVFDPDKISHNTVKARLKKLWAQDGRQEIAGQCLEVPVVYGGPQGEDLPMLAQKAGMHIDGYVAAHSAQEYVVYALGSQPGFAYLGGLDPRLICPRRAVPRKKVLSGSVIIGGTQAGILSRTTPSGWHIIGKTDLEFFNPNLSRPALLNPGDRLRFVVKDLIRD